MAKQVFPRHRLQPVMLPVITPREYLRQAQQTPDTRHILNNEELEKAQSFPIAKRQEEWLTARISAKMAILQYHSSFTSNYSTLYPKEITIINDQTGRPAFSGVHSRDVCNTDLSISHGAGFALALIADSRCGIDIQEPRESASRVRDKFCSPEEEELLRQTFSGLPEVHYLTLLWVAKEAAKKALSHSRMPGFLELILTDLEAHVTGWAIRFLVSSRQYQGYPPTITVIAELYEQYSLALCLSEENINA